MKIFNAAKLTTLLTIGSMAFPAPGRSEVHSRGVDQAQAGTSGSSIVPSSGRLETRSGGSQKRPAWKAEFAEQVAQAQRAEQPFQCPHCTNGISDRLALYRHIKALHGPGKPVFSLKNYHDEHEFDGGTGRWPLGASITEETKEPR
ncbi:hypothetical protein PspLS_09935 [Pyricularia sp. CBS 133598]|nr:hypothetical protein PspLS_09935 [Pyricularia sp. CBS 133598]